MKDQFGIDKVHYHMIYHNPDQVELKTNHSITTSDGRLDQLFGTGSVRIWAYICRNGSGMENG